METQSLSSKSLSPWKKLAVISVFGGIGFALMSALLIAGVYWYTSRPARPKPWMTNVIVAADSPGFGVSKDGQNIVFSYTLHNQGTSDYRLDSSSDIQFFAREKDGTLLSPLTDPTKHIELPVFIPAKQKSMLQLLLPFPSVPKRAPSESDSTFHERIRAYLEHNYGDLGGFVIFDPANRYEIDLRRWLASPPPDKPTHQP